MNDILNTNGARRLSWSAAIKSGLLAGALFLVIPLGSPWSGLAFSSGAVMGRAVSVNGTFQSAGKVALHLLVSVVYAVIIGEVVKGLRGGWGVVAGAGLGLVLYIGNAALVSLLAPRLTGMEERVIFTHVVFGVMAAALYKGMTRTRPERHSHGHS
jgi:hypothetical protein